MVTSSNFFADPQIVERLRQLEASKVFSSSGGNNRAKALPSKRRSDIARKAAKTRWDNLQEDA